MVKVKDNPFLERDERTGAINNTNKTEIELARRQKKLRLEKREREDSLDKDVSNLKQRMHIMENLLTEILEKL